MKAIYKGKRIDTKEWITGFVIIGQIASVILNHERIIRTKNKSPKDNFKFFRVIPSSVRHFTGLYDSTKWNSLTENEQDLFTISLKDKSIPASEQWKGKMIFEGDIIKLDDNADIVKGTEMYDPEDVIHCLVYWDEDRAMFYDRRLEDGESTSGYVNGDISCLTDGIIVGNDFDTPDELLQLDL